MTSFVDPYVYPNESVLVNLFDEHDPRKFNERERRETWLGRQSLVVNPVKQTFDLLHLQELHRRLFDHVFSWAGELRTVDISKGNSYFMPAERLVTGGAAIAVYLRDSGLLERDVDGETFVHAAARVLSDVNYLHPFREGNGRAQRAFLDDIARVSGRFLAWRNVSQHDHMLASIEAFDSGTGAAFEPLFRRMLVAPRDGLSPLDSRLYDVHEPRNSSKSTKEK